MGTINEIHNFWGIGSKNINSDEFTGYESVYHQLDKFDKPAFNKDPEYTVSSVFDIYRSVNLVPIIYYTEKGILRAIREFKDSTQT
jgi:hypothetical protein